MRAEEGGYAVGAFNVYNLEGAMAVVAAAEAENSPAILQIHPGALNHGGYPLVSCCIAAAKHAKVPVTVHLDHGSEETAVIDSLELGFDSVMVDGSHLAFEDNVAFTKKVADIAHAKGMTVEAELGRLSGTEDGLSVEEYEAQFTDLNQVFENSEICYLNSFLC
jgi:ketose-bisphosphate aldolase